MISMLIDPMGISVFIFLDESVANKLFTPSSQNLSSSAARAPHFLTSLAFPLQSLMLAPPHLPDIPILVCLWAQFLEFLSCLSTLFLMISFNFTCFNIYTTAFISPTYFFLGWTQGSTINCNPNFIWLKVSSCMKLNKNPNETYFTCCLLHLTHHHIHCLPPHLNPHHLLAVLL